MKKYDKIKNKGILINNFKDRGLVIQEKLDGSNASFTLNNQVKLESFSRNRQLDENETLNGFYGFVQDRFSPDNLNTLQIYRLQSYIIFGEWLVKHKVQYKDSCYHKFYMFDAYDKLNKRYVSYEDMLTIADTLGLNTVNTLKVMKPSDKIEELKTEDVQGLVGNSDLTLSSNTGEGIVIKYLNERSEDDDSFKIVSNEFKEFSKTKMKSEIRNHDSVADYAITKTRMEKMIFRAIEENRLSESDLELENFALVMKQIGQNFVDDIMEEEKENILKIIEKQIKKKMPHVLRDILDGKGEIIND